MARAGSRVAMFLLAMALVSGSAEAEQQAPWRVLTLVAPTRAEPPTAAPPTTSFPVPAPLTAGLDLRAGPVTVPLELRLPSLGSRLRVAGVGLTAAGAMDAPVGGAKDPVWQEAFWYRGSAVPGEPSTALIAGHIDDSLGRLAAFGSIDALRPGDPIVVHDNRTALDVVFSVTRSMTYSLAEANDPAVLEQIYGAGPIRGRAPTPSSDGLAHLTLITCAGTFRNGTHDHRLVVYATRTG